MTFAGAAPADFMMLCRGCAMTPESRRAGASAVDASHIPPPEPLRSKMIFSRVMRPMRGWHFAIDSRTSRRFRRGDAMPDLAYICRCGTRSPGFSEGSARASQGPHGVFSSIFRHARKASMVDFSSCIVAPVVGPLMRDEAPVVKDDKDALALLRAREATARPIAARRR